MVGLQGSLVLYSLSPCKSRPVPIPMRLYHPRPAQHPQLPGLWLAGPDLICSFRRPGRRLPRRPPVGCGCLLASYRRIDKRNAHLPPVSGPCAHPRFSPAVLLPAVLHSSPVRKIPWYILIDQLPSDRLHLHPAGVAPGYTARCSTTRGVSHASHVACSSGNTSSPATATWPSVQTSLSIFEHIRGLAVRLQHV